MSDDSGVREDQILRSLIREARLAAGQRQSDLAEKLGQPQSFVSKVESGERRLDVLELRQVCLALNLSIVDLLYEFERKLERV